ncbi:MAG: amidohydrolase [Chloroflexi bacterium]|nr:amidohydrolase [Chloroflexota bacterium]
MSSSHVSHLKAEADALRERLIEVRRDLHAHPELGFEEFRTAGIVTATLTELGYEVQTGVGKTGVVGLMEGGEAGDETLLLRFDMDALPILEAVDVDFKSISNGKMHACGHDAHTSIGLAVARILSNNRHLWKGTAKFVFQPAEETIGGALAMIKDGVLQSPAPTRSLSMHVWSTLPVGKIAVVDGPLMAAAATFDLTVTGRGAHGASPHEGVDPIVAAAQIITALQSIVARNVAPLDAGVITVGSIHAGSAPNIIPDQVAMRGTIRSFKDEVMTLIRRRMQEVVAGMAAAMSVRAELQFADGTPATVNDAAMASIVRGVAQEMVGQENVPNDVRTMGAEDCAYFLKAAPGAYVFVGAGNVEKGIDEPHHSPRFQIDEDSLPISAALVAASAVRMLQ